MLNAMPFMKSRREISSFRLIINSLSNRTNQWIVPVIPGINKFVRAEDLGVARLLAARAYGIATKQVLGEEVKIVPWDYSGLVRVTQVQASDDYAEDGSQGIVFPAAAVGAAGPGYQGNN